MTPTAAGPSWSTLDYGRDQASCRPRTSRSTCNPRRSRTQLERPRRQLPQHRQADHRISSSLCRRSLEAKLTNERSGLRCRFPSPSFVRIHEVVPRCSQRTHRPQQYVPSHTVVVGSLLTMCCSGRVHPNAPLLPPRRIARRPRNHLRQRVRQLVDARRPPIRQRLRVEAKARRRSPTPFDRDEQVGERDQAGRETEQYGRRTQESANRQGARVECQGGRREEEEGRELGSRTSSFLLQFGWAFTSSLAVHPCLYIYCSCSWTLDLQFALVDAGPFEDEVLWSMSPRTCETASFAHTVGVPRRPHLLYLPYPPGDVCLPSAPSQALRPLVS